MVPAAGGSDAAGAAKPAAAKPAAGAPGGPDPNWKSAKTRAATPIPQPRATASLDQTRERFLAEAAKKASQADAGDAARPGAAGAARPGSPSSESSFEDDDWTVTSEQRKTRPKLAPSAGADGDDPAVDMIKVDQTGPHFTGPAATAPAS